MLETIENFVFVGMLFSALCIVTGAAAKFVVMPILGFIAEIKRRFIDKARGDVKNG